MNVLDLRFYIDLIPYTDVQLNEEQLGKDDIIKKAKKYSNYKETRMYINRSLRPLTKELMSRTDYIDNANPNPSKDESKPGLSVYMNVTIKHPNNLTTEQIEQYYKYSIRFSDHKDHHDNNNRFHVKEVGVKLGDLAKAGQDVFDNNLEEIQRRIREFEISELGQQYTFITDDPDGSDNENNTNITTEGFRLRIKE